MQQADSLRAVLDSVFADRTYQWTERPQPLAALRQVVDRLRHWLVDLRESHPELLRIALYAMLVVAMIMVLRAAASFYRMVRAADRTAPDSSPRFVPRDRAWYRKEADRLAASGYFAEAIQADFLALILTLDVRGVLRFHPSKTPAEYAREFRQNRGTAAGFDDLVDTLYRYAFARLPCGADDFAAWRQRSAPERYAPAN